MQLSPIEQSFSINYRYTLYFTEKLFDTRNELLRNIIHAYKPGEAVKVFFVVDEGLYRHHPYLLEAIESYCEKNKHILDYTGHFLVEGGEQSKNNEAYVEHILQAINKSHICRHSFLIAIGGGAVIDMAGYAAAIAHRGVKLIRIPSTVLSQNDAAVGVKNGINYFQKKNFIGSFAPPFAIINNSDFLTTLDQRDWIAGIAEAVKVALIKDRAFFHYLEEQALPLKNRDMKVMNEVIYRCAKIHMDHIAGGGDPFESGSSRPLDFGHWAAHKLEQMTNYSLRHGEAVAKGIALDVTYAHLMGMISREVLNSVLALMETIGFDLLIPLHDEKGLNELLKGIQEFREHLGGRLTITLITGIGLKHDVHDIDLGTMKRAVYVLNDTCTSNVV
jgi:3-dehydroquinate synthase